MGSRLEEALKLLAVASGSVIFTATLKLLPEERREVGGAKGAVNVIIIADEARRLLYGFRGKVSFKAV